MESSKPRPQPQYGNSEGPGNSHWTKGGDSKKYCRVECENTETVMDFETVVTIMPCGESGTTINPNV